VLQQPSLAMTSMKAIWSETVSEQDDVGGLNAMEGELEIGYSWLRQLGVRTAEIKTAKENLASTVGRGSGRGLIPGFLRSQRPDCLRLCETAGTETAKLLQQLEQRRAVIRSGELERTYQLALVLQLEIEDAICQLREQLSVPSTVGEPTADPWLHAMSA
jgi:hypothetical protein